MTREEAREILTHNWTRVDNPNYSESELDEAFFMAIEALSADTVSREEYEELYRKAKEVNEMANDILADFPSYKELLSVANLKEEFESANATPTVIRAKTFMRKEDFDKWAEDIKKQNKSIVCIPCDAEVVSDDAVVRCKDCRHRDLFSCPLADNDFQKDDDYCSWGERREE